MHLVLCLGGLPLLPLDLGPAKGVGVPLGCRLGRAGSLPLLLLLRERAKWELPARCRLPFPAPPMSLTLPNSDRYRSRRGSSTGLDPRIDTGRAVTALTGRGDRSRRQRRRSPARRGGRRDRSCGRPLSRISRVTARGQAGDYLAPLPACGQRRQDGWPDEKPRRVLGRLPRSLLWFLKPRRPSLLLQEGRL